jgi:hypothetical protein
MFTFSELQYCFSTKSAAPSVNYKLAFVMGLFSFLFGSCSKKPSSLTVIDHEVEKPVGIVNTEAAPISVPSASRFRPGQVWAFRAPADQPSARLTILRVEDGGKLGRIIHVALSGVSYGVGQTSIQHLPFAESAIEDSVTLLNRETGPIPDFADGYQQWREAFAAGKGGIFSISVAEAFDVVTGVLARKK